MSARWTFSRGRRPSDSAWISRIGRRVKSPSPHSPCSTPSALARRIRWTLLSDPVFVEEESAFATQVGEERLPGRPAGARGDALTRRQRHEESVHAEASLEFAHEVGARLGAPQFRQDEHVGVQTHDVVENVRRSTPAVDTGVKVKRRDTHVKTLGGLACRSWQALHRGICQRGLRSPTLVGRRLHRRGRARQPRGRGVARALDARRRTPTDRLRTRRLRDGLRASRGRPVDPALVHARPSRSISAVTRRSRACTCC